MSPTSDIEKTQMADSVDASQSPSTKLDFQNENVDEALAVFNEVEREGEVLIHVDDDKLRWKIDLRVLPLM